MKKILTLFATSWLLCVPALNFGQVLSVVESPSFRSYSKATPAYFTAIGYAELLSNEQAIMSSHKAINTFGDSKEKKNNLSVATINSDPSLSVIFFETTNCYLEKTAIYELDRVAKILSDSPTIHIEISGHTDNVGSKEYNHSLSKKRIDAVLFYFKNQYNIDKKRMVVKNYGETMPLAGNETEEGRELNHRVELALKASLLTNN